MLSTILDKANEIKQEKDTKIIPENIKAGITAFGVEGTYDGESSAPINSIIEQYKASTDTINANTFVEFVNNINTDVEFNFTEQLSNDPYSATDAKCIALGSNRVLIIYRNNNTDKYLSGIIINISGNSFSLGQQYVLSDKANSSSNADVVLIDTDRVFIVHRYGGSGSDKTYVSGLVCTISGTVITPGTDTILVNELYSSLYVSAVKLDTDKVFVAHSYSASDYRLNGIVCSISGTSISVGADTPISNSNRSAEGVSMCVIDTNKVFIAHKNNDSDKYLAGIVCSISGTSISLGTNTILVEEENSFYNSTSTLIAENKVLVLHRGNSGDCTLNGIVCSISNITITPSIDTTIDSTVDTGQKITSSLLDNNKLFVAHSASAFSNIKARILSIQEDIPISGEANTVNINPQYLSSTVYDLDKVFVNNSTGSGSTGYLLTGSTFYIPKYYKTVKSSETKIDGITKNECTTSTAGDVYVLNT